VFILVKMIALVFISLMNLILKKKFLGLSSWKLWQKLHYIQRRQDDDITKLGVSKKQKPLGIGMHENGAWAHSPNVQNDLSTSF